MSVYISLGSNLGDRHFYIREMISFLQTILRPPFFVSPLMETAPLEVNDEQAFYLNAVVKGEFDGSPYALFTLLRSCEDDLGRTNKGEKKARTADLDILYFNRQIIASDTLVIPHPAISSRRFILDGLCAIDPDGIDPQSMRSFFEMKNEMSYEVASQKIKIIV